MLSIAALHDDAANYYCRDEKLGRDDYYLKGSEPPGVWYGGESLGLSGVVEKDDFANVREGKNPKTGKMLVGTGGHKNKHHAGWDFTFSAPKSVSIAYARAEGELKNKILEAHNEAVKEAMDYIKEDVLTAATRRVKTIDGKKVEFREQPKELVAAMFNHQTSRELDPQIHTHTVVANLAQRNDGTWGALKAKQAFEFKKAAGAAYRASLNYKLENELGIACEKDREFFRIKSVPKSLEEDFSKRRKQIEQAMNKAGVQGAKAAASKTLATRANKGELDHNLLETAWKNEMDRDGFTLEQFERSNEAQQTPHHHNTKQVDLISSSIEQLGEKESAFKKQQIAEKAFELSQGLKPLSESRKDLQKLEQHHGVVNLRDGHKAAYTSVEIQRVEKKMLETAVELSKSKPRSLDKYQADKQIAAYEQAHSTSRKKIALTEDQAKAVEFALHKSGRFTMVEGVAGAGKSFSMGAIRHVYEGQGYRVSGLAPTGKAAQNLEESGIKCQTIHRFILRNEKLSSRDVVICDEAAMVGSRKTKQLLDEVKRSGAKLIVVGESEQAQPIEAGGAFRSIARHVEKESITRIFRQKESWQREAVMLFRIGDSKEALKLYETHKCLRVSETEHKLKEQMTDEFVKYRIKSPEKMQIIVTRNNADVGELNKSIRSKLQENGIVEAKEYQASIENTKGKAERSFSAGDSIVFLKNDNRLNVRNGTMGKIKNIKPDSKGHARYLEVKVDKRKVFSVDLFNYNHMDHSYAVTIHKSQGSTLDRVLVHANPTMSRELAYVANSRHKEEVLLFGSLDKFGKDLSNEYEPLFKSRDETIKEHLVPDMSKAFEKSEQKESSLDYESVPKQEKAREIKREKDRGLEL